MSKPLPFLSLACVAILACSRPEATPAQIKATKDLMGMVAGVAAAWRASPGHSVQCPTFDVLRAEHEIAATGPGPDPWGTDYRMTCEASSVTVTSAGPDKAFGTADDLVAQKSFAF